VLAEADTDTDGRFSLGSLTMNAELNYPSATRVEFAYEVAKPRRLPVRVQLSGFGTNLSADITVTADRWPHVGLRTG
jgi:hypothetical protein